ncbi:unnamed protein product [Soboliphyme baturini]|uniref:Reverse transcriptase domain-containing protein n=1 Tax=Soboliphyme baturini TaxID=241478 RepID=A0A183J9I2_9BILA|nr:unnamed protein product [Soboliphyme baturini]
MWIGVLDVKTRRLLFADDLVLLASSETVLHCSLERFAGEYAVSGMRINGEAVEQVEKLKYLGMVFTSDGKLEEEMDRRIGIASGVLRELARPVVANAELRLKTKLSIFKSILIPILTYGHESWTITEKLRTRVRAAEMGFLGRVAGLSRLDMVENSDIQKSLGLQPLLL